MCLISTCALTCGQIVGCRLTHSGGRCVSSRAAVGVFSSSDEDEKGIVCAKRRIEEAAARFTTRSLRREKETLLSVSGLEV